MMVLITRMATIMRPRWKQFRQKSFACYSSTHYSKHTQLWVALAVWFIPESREDACFYFHGLMGGKKCLNSFKIRTQTSRSGTWINAFQIAGKYGRAEWTKNTSWSIYLCCIAYAIFWIYGWHLGDSGLFEEAILGLMVSFIFKSSKCWESKIGLLINA